MKRLVIILLVLVSTLFINEDVYASITLKKYTDNSSHPYASWLNLEVCSTGTGKDCVNHNGSVQNAYWPYKSQIKYFIYNGNNYPAICIDPDRHAATSYVCETETDVGMIYLFNLIDQNLALTDDVYYSKMELAVRFYSVMTGYAQGGDSDYNGGFGGWKAAIIRMNQIRANGMINDSNVSQNMWDYFRDASSKGENSYALEAWNLALQAKAVSDSSSSSSTSTESVSTSVSYKIDSASTASNMIFNLTSTAEIAQLEAVCDGCTLVSQTWSGTSGTITVVPADDCQEFNIKLYFNPKGVQRCKAKNGVNDYQYLLTAFDVADTENLDTTGDPTMTITEKGIGCEESCCTLSPTIEPGNIEGDVNNCCYDNTVSEAHEYDLNDLFCYDKTMQVQYYWAKCNAEYYIDKNITSRTEASDYCTIYCTERIYIEIPSAITATSGRYFTLTTTNEGTKSPYVEGYKRCRTIIDYDKWHDDYIETVKREISYYNLYQEKEAWYLMYDNSIESNHVDHTDAYVSWSCEVQTDTQTKDCPYTGSKACYKDANGNEVEKGTTGATASTCDTSETDSISATSKTYSTKTGTYNIKYTVYYFTSKNYYTTKLSSDTNHDTVTVEYEGTHTISKSSVIWWYGSEGTIQEQYAKLEQWLKDNQDDGKEISGSEQEECSDYNSSCCITSKASKWVCSRGYIVGTEEDVKTTRATYLSQATSANNSYNSAVNSAKTLENKLTYCDFYLVGGDSRSKANAQTDYDFAIEFGGFVYTQAYLDEYGSAKIDTVDVNFESTPGCTFYGPLNTYGDEDNLVEPQYSAIYGTSTENMNDFQYTTLSWASSATAYTQFLDGSSAYQADKKFTQDGKYKVVCSWDESTNTKYTLVPSGAIDTNYIVTNYTKNERLYTTYLTTFEATYDTYWKLTGRGSSTTNGAGKFDEYFRENGKSCTGITTDYAHCGLKIEHEITYVGKCNPSSGYTVTEASECEAVKSVETLFNFKIVDPDDVFTSCDSYESCGYAYNWFKGTNGTSTLNKIETEGKASTTYSPDNQTYSFTLTPSDMKNIKNYNTYLESSGYGYSDFNLTCTCPDEAEECNNTGETQTCKRGSSCNTCYSTFITNLYSGIVSYGGTEHSVTTATGTLQSIRDNNHWVS